MRMRTRTVAAGLALLALAFGCQQTEGQAVVRCEAASPDGWPGCSDLEHTFTFEADFFALQRFEDQYNIRLQRGGKGADVSNGFQIQVMSGDEIPDCRLQAIELETPDHEATSPGQFPSCRDEIGCRSPADCPLVRMVAHFPKTCPASAPSLVAGDPPGDPSDPPSSISFGAFGARPGDRVSGDFDVRIADGRTGETAGRCNTGDDGFSFIVKEGQPYVRFVE